MARGLWRHLWICGYTNSYLRKLSGFSQNHMVHLSLQTWELFCSKLCRSPTRCSQIKADFESLPLVLNPKVRIDWNILEQIFKFGLNASLRSSPCLSSTQKTYCNMLFWYCAMQIFPKFWLCELSAKSCIVVSRRHLNYIEVKLVTPFHFKSAD